MLPNILLKTETHVSINLLILSSITQNVFFLFVAPCIQKCNRIEPTTLDTWPNKNKKTTVYKTEFN